jgi:SAM-dependent methyltransferase
MANSHFLGAGFGHLPPALGILVLISLPAALLVYYLFNLYKFDARDPKDRFVRVSFDAGELGSSNYRDLVLVSFLSLFLEMLMIRWISSEIRVFAYLKNFVLVACFLGFGLGCNLSRRRIHLIAMIGPLVLLVVLLKAHIRSPLMALPQLLGGGVDVHIWGVPAAPASWTGVLTAIIAVVPLFAVIAMSFVPIGQMVGWYLETAADGVIAYSLNVLASLMGIVCYAVLCFMYQPPATWFLVAGIAAVALFWRYPKQRKFVGTAFLFCTCLLLLPESRHERTYWSPYQKLQLRTNTENGELVSYVLNTNGSWYQQILNLSQEFVSSHPSDFKDDPIAWNSYNLPYHFFPSPPSVLVLGSGMGNDVAAALRNGAGCVTAVEIDPLILALGRKLHFEHPYESPRTHVVINDARSYIQNSKDHFDLIVFSLLDSHTTTSSFSNIRIDNFVYTREAMQQAKNLLTPNGLFIVKFQVDTPWIAGRLFALASDVFGQKPIQFQSDSGKFDTPGRFFVAGSSNRVRMAMSDPALAAYVSSHSHIAMEPAIETTDDWPYLYQHAPGLPLSIILVSIAILLTFAWFLRRLSEKRDRIQLHFFFLGAGFMLLEAQIVSRMALLFGTTWMVNSVVVAGLLLLIVAANLAFKSVRRVPIWLIYALLFVSLAALYVVPTRALLLQSLLARVTIATLAFCLPAFFASLIFIESFSRAGFQARALGSNLFGALAGGLLESLSLWFGLKSLTLVAALLYIASAIAIFQKIQTTDSERELELLHSKP